MSSKKGIHHGHKERLRKKFCKNDNFSVFEDHEIIEMMLNYVCVRRDQNETAHNLIERFGSVKGVLDADRWELLEVDKVGKGIATYILMIRQLFAEYNRDASQLGNVRVSQIDLADYVKSLFDGVNKENFYMLCVNKGGKIIKSHFMGSGTTTGVLLDQREVLSVALSSNAKGVIFAHNHPMGFAVASEEDIVSTKSMEKYLKGLDIEMIDHFIVAEDKCVSIREDTRYKYYK